jgi:NDP-sugar pyrophosphorylase family protein
MAFDMFGRSGFQKRADLYVHDRRAASRHNKSTMKSSSPKTAVLLAGGLGSRLRPYTVVLPKPLMPIGEMPILEVIIKQLAQHGFRRIILAVNHQAELMRAYFGRGEKLGVDITYTLEKKPLGTMGPLRLIDDLPAHFIVMNGDILCDLDFSRFLQTHEREDRLFTIAAAYREHIIDYGVLVANDAGHLTAFQEKPRSTYLVSMGVYCVNRQIVDLIPVGQPYGFDQLMLTLIASGQDVRIAPHTGYWLDIGRPDDYFRAIEEWPRFRTTLGL